MANASTSDGRMTQNEMVLWYLRTVGPITPMDALKEFGIMRLASRVSDIRKKDMLRPGERLMVKTVEFTNRMGRSSHYAEYSIVNEEGEKAG